MRTLTIDGDKFPIPENWNELTRQQLVTLGQLNRFSLPVGEFQFKMLLAFTGLVPERKPEVQKINYKGERRIFHHMANGRRKYLIEQAELAWISEQLNFFFKKTKNDEKEEQFYVHSTLTKNLLPDIDVKGKTWYGPSDSLTNLLFAEFIHTETFLDYYGHTKKPEYLDKLIATIYRPQDPEYNPKSVNFHGDRREKFNDHLIDMRAVKLAEVHPAVKQAIYLFYLGCRNFIVKKFPKVFPPSSGNEKKKDAFMQFMKLVDALANNDVTKNEQIRQTYLYEVMVSLQAAAEQKERIEEMYKKK